MTVDGVLPASYGDERHQEVHVPNHPPHPARRDFLRAATTAAAAAVVGLRSGRVAAEPPPETTTLKLVQFPSGCQGPLYVAEDLLRGEGFTDVRYVGTANPEEPVRLVETRAADIAFQFSAPLIREIDRGAAVLTLGGVHAGCFVLFGRDNVRSVRDLKGKIVSVPVADGSAQMYVASMAAYVGVNPARDITWVTHPVDDATRLFADGKVDAILGFPPLPQELRARKIGHVVVDSTIDRPWSQYFCCMMLAHKDFPRKYPVAAKRVVRAIVKANAICAQEPERVARLLVDRGVVKRYDYALGTIKELPYARWRDYDSADTLRFYALRLHEAGMVKSSPQKIIAQGSDLRFIDELKKELKG
jgi:NitT/TauT family transport system substrate-binding protein